MIYSVTAENQKGEQLEMRLSCPQFSGMNIYEIEGLGTPKADINFTSMAAVNGRLFNSTNARSRTVIFHIKYVDSLFVGSPGCMYPAENIGVCTDDYNDLVDKPQINGVELTGNKSGETLSLQDTMDPITKVTIDALLRKYHPRGTL